ncbi:hypothetical protein L1887_52847 [Cichorium endivia]|nr:hypothetical protein L1887_52847 [Cichorium endivia]
MACSTGRGAGGFFSRERPRESMAEADLPAQSGSDELPTQSEFADAHRLATSPSYTRAGAYRPSPPATTHARRCTRCSRQVSARRCGPPRCPALASPASRPHALWPPCPTRLFSMLPPAPAATRW